MTRKNKQSQEKYELCPRSKRCSLPVAENSPTIDTIPTIRNTSLVLSEASPVLGTITRRSPRLSGRTQHLLVITPPETTPPPPKERKIPKKPEKKRAAKKMRTFMFQHRSNILAVIRLIERIRLTKAHKDVLKQTPFWHFFESILNQRYVESLRCKKNENIIVEIIESYNYKQQAFHIGGKDLLPSSRDIGLIFGIKQGSEPLDITQGSRKSSQFVKRIFGNINNISKVHIENAINESLKGRSGRDYEDVAKLLCLHALLTVFFSGSSHILTRRYIHYVDDLQNMAKYAWCDAIRDKLIKSVQKMHQKPAGVTGCVIALLYWLCEHTNLVQPNIEKGFPRYIKWHLGTLSNNLVERRIPTLRPEEVLEDELKLTDLEISVLVEETLATQNNQIILSNNESDTQTVLHEMKPWDRQEVMTEHDKLDALCDKILGSISEFHSADALQFVSETNFEHLERETKQHEGKFDGYISLGTAIDNINRIAHEVCGHEEEIKALKTESNNALNLLKELVVNHVEDQKKLVHVEKENKVVNEANKQLREECDNIKKENEKVNEENKHLKEETERLEAEIDMLKNGQRNEKRLCAYDYGTKSKKRRQEEQLKSEQGEEDNDDQEEDDQDFLDIENYTCTEPAPNEINYPELKRDGPVCKFLSANEFQRLQNIIAQDGYTAIIYKEKDMLCQGLYISMEDIMTLLLERAITNIVIDCLGQILLKQQEEARWDGSTVPNKTCFVNSHCWTIITRASESYKEKEIYSRVCKAIQDNVRYIQFPMNSKGRQEESVPFHWTLLVYDMHEGMWRHYHSNRGSGLYDSYFEDAKSVKENVERYLRKAYKEACEKQLKSMGEIDLFQSERMQILASQGFDCPILQMNDSPQQVSRSVDSGIIVAYMMMKLAMGMKYESYLPPEILQWTRASIAKMFINFE
ncbi:hypothetical protein ACSBR2_029436 [Camellia fascicularis]